MSEDPVSCIAEMLMQLKFPPIYGMKAVAEKIALLNITFFGYCRRNFLGLLCSYPLLAKLFLPQAVALRDFVSLGD
jgi:hypothetical protein